MGLSDSVWNGNNFNHFLDDLMDFWDSFFYFLNDDFFNDFLNNYGLFDCVCLFNDLHLRNFYVFDDFLLNR